MVYKINKMLFLRVGLVVSVVVSLSIFKGNADDPICYVVKKYRTTTQVQKVDCMDAAKYKPSHIKRFESVKEFSMTALLGLADEAEQTTTSTPVPFIQNKLGEPVPCSDVSTRQNRLQSDPPRTTVDSLKTSIKTATSIPGSHPLTSQTSGDILSQTVSSDLPRSKQTSNYTTNTGNVTQKPTSMTSQSSSHHMRSSFQNGTTPLTVCNMLLEYGQCRGLNQRFGFEDGACRSFMYGGCGGNANNFLTLEDCLQTCQNGSLSSGTESSTSTSDNYTTSKNRTPITPLK